MQNGWGDIHPCSLVVVVVVAAVVLAVMFVDCLFFCFVARLRFVVCFVCVFVCLLLLFLFPRSVLYQFVCLGLF